VGANVHISWLDPHKVRSMTVVGSRKMLVFDDVDTSARVKVYDKGISKVQVQPGSEESPLGSHRTFEEFQLLVRAGEMTVPKIDFPEPLQAECRHFVDCVRDATRPLTDGREALRVVGALEAAQASLERRGAWVAVGAPGAGG
jgi:predicted dehydrogenase